MFEKRREAVLVTQARLGEIRGRRSWPSLWLLLQLEPMTTIPQRRDRARGEQQTLGALGWAARESVSQRASVELTASRNWKVGRLWTANLTLEATSLPRGWVRVLLGVDGHGLLHLGEDRIELAPQQMVLLDGRTAISTMNSAIWARCEWQINTPALQQDRLVEQFKKPLTLDKAHHTLLTAMTNVVSTRNSLGGSWGSGVFGDALAGTVTAAVLEASGTTTALSPTQARIVRTAIETIEERYRDSTFSVSDIATATSISVAHLHRLFAATGTTPRQALEERRLSAADTILAATPARDKGALEHAAEQAGFGSARRLRDATRRR